MSTVVQSADTYLTRFKESFWAIVLGAGEQHLSAILAEMTGLAADLESVIASREAVADQAQARASPAPQQQQHTGVQIAEYGAEPAPRNGNPAVRVLRHEAFQEQAVELYLDLAAAPARKQQRKTSGDDAAGMLSEGCAMQERVQGGAEGKPCKCKKSRCLKLYCDCFSTGHFCNETCFCMDCQNRTSSAPVVFRARTFILARDNTAFQPKVAQSIAHVKGCHCRKSRCLKKYCECYHGNVRCTDACRCVSCLNKGPRPEQQEGPAEGVMPGQDLTQEVDAERVPTAAAPRKVQHEQHLNQELSLADLAMDFSISLEGASAKQPRFAGAQDATSESGEESLEEGTPYGSKPHPHELGRSEAAGMQAALGAKQWAAGQSAGNTSASLEDSSMADDATSPPPCVSRRGRLISRRNAATGARAPMIAQPPIDPNLAGGWRTWLPEEAKALLHTAKRRRLSTRPRIRPSPQPTPDKQRACAALQEKVGLMPTTWRPVLMEVHGNTAGRPVAPGRQKHVETTAADAENEFLTEEDAAQALLML